MTRASGVKERIVIIVKKVIVIVLLVIVAAVAAGCGGGGNETAAKNLFTDYLKLEEHCLNTGDVPDKTVMFEKYFWEGSKKSSYHGEQGWTGMVQMANQTAGNVKVKYDIVDIEAYSVMDEEKDVRTAEQAVKQAETGLSDLQEVTATVKMTLVQGSERKTMTHQYKALVGFISNPKRAFINEIVMVR